MTLRFGMYLCALVTEKAMKTSFILILIQLFEAQAELMFKRLTEGQTLELSCCPQLDHGGLMGLHLYHRGARSQTTLLSMAESGELRVDPSHRGRLQLCGGLGEHRVNVTMTRLQPSDTGLYTWELSYGENISEQILPSPLKAFVLVEGTGNLFQRSLRYPPLLLAIFIATVLLLLTFIWLAVERRVRAKRQHRPRPPVPIYEEMTRKQQSAGIPQNNPESPSHQGEVSFPLYANPNIRQPQDNYYACPRQFTLSA